MTKISVVVAAVLVLASASSNVAFAAMTPNRAVAQGQTQPQSSYYSQVPNQEGNWGNCRWRRSNRHGNPYDGGLSCSNL